MASFSSPRSSRQLLRNVVVRIFVITLTAAMVVDSAAPNNKKPTIEVYPSCRKTFMPKRCSFKLSALSKNLAETKAIIAGPPIATNNKLKNDSCVLDCAKVLGTTASSVAAAEAGDGDVAGLKDYLYQLMESYYGPIGPCECNCPEPCTADEAAAVKKLGDATGAMRDMSGLLQELLGDQTLTNKEKKAKGRAMEKSMDSGVLHVSCGLTKEPQKCVDELAALGKTMKEAGDVAWDLKTSDKETRLASTITDCYDAMRDLREQLAWVEGRPLNLADLRGAIHSYVQGDAKHPPRCKYSCPSPPEKPCSANETAIADKLNGVYGAWIATEKFLTELLTPN